MKSKNGRKIVLWLLSKNIYLLFRNPFLKDIHLAALILARGGSKSIPLKNIAFVGNRTLLERSLSAIKATEGFTSIWVSTDHHKISEVSFKSDNNRKDEIVFW